MLACTYSAYYHVPMPQLIASVEGVEIKHVFLQKDRTTLGRKPDNDIVFDNMVVSGHHCVFELQGLADVHIEDLGSTNGTYVNGRMIKRHKLNDGEVISIGNFRIQYVAESARPGFMQTTAFTVQAPVASGKLPQAVFQVLNGESTGQELPIVKTVSTFGAPGVSVVAVTQRRDGYYVAHLGGDSRPTLNGEPLGAHAMLLSNHDVLDAGGTRMLFQLKDQPAAPDMNGAQTSGA